jgi:hypothetical protein
LHGNLHIFKTREDYIAEASVPIYVCEGVDEDHQLRLELDIQAGQYLIESDINDLKLIKTMFKKIKSGLLELKFEDKKVNFKCASEDIKQNFDISTSLFSSFGYYRSQVEEGTMQSQNYTITVPLRYLVNLISICDLARSKFHLVMERQTVDTSQLILKAQSYQKDLIYQCVIPTIRFQDLETP